MSILSAVIVYYERQNKSAPMSVSLDREILIPQKFKNIFTVDSADDMDSLPGTSSYSCVILILQDK